jgi:hypothetical protein
MRTVMSLGFQIECLVVFFNDKERYPLIFKTPSSNICDLVKSVPNKKCGHVGYIGRKITEAFEPLLYA